MARPGAAAVPLPVPIPAALAAWEAAGARPELAAVAAWSAACRAWWDDRDDARLRDRCLDRLALTGAELAGWLDERLDPAAVIHAHRHVIGARLAAEQDLSRRDLETGALRSTRAALVLRDGRRKELLDPSRVSAELGRALAALGELPAEPVLRAAWLQHALVAIHPFRDGNGGTSRFLASIELARAALPPLAISRAQRSGGHVHALSEADRTGRLEPLFLTVADALQQGLAAALTTGRSAAPAVWSEPARARAARWLEIAGRRRAGHAAAGAVARLGRRGYRLPATPEARGTTWSGEAPLPWQIDLAIAPVDAAGGWLVAAIAASLSGDAALGAIERGEEVAAWFVAPDGEPDEIADARFAAWIETRMAQCERAVAGWS